MNQSFPSSHVVICLEISDFFAGISIGLLTLFSTIITHHQNWNNLASVRKSSNFCVVPQSPERPRNQRQDLELQTHSEWILKEQRKLHFFLGLQVNTLETAWELVLLLPANKALHPHPRHTHMHTSQCVRLKGLSISNTKTPKNENLGKQKNPLLPWA